MQTIKAQVTALFKQQLLHGSRHVNTRARQRQRWTTSAITMTCTQPF